MISPCRHRAVRGVRDLIGLPGPPTAVTSPVSGDSAIVTSLVMTWKVGRHCKSIILLACWGGGGGSFVTPMHLMTSLLFKGI